MKRLLLTLALLFPSLAAAQGQQITAGPFPNSGLLYVCPVPSGGTPCPSPVSIFSNATLTIGISNPVIVFAQQTYTFFVASGQYTLEMPASGTQQVVSVGGGGGTSPNGAMIYAWDPAYGVKGTAKHVCDATFTLNSSTVTTPATDRPFTAADVGDIMFGSTANCSGSGTIAVPIIRIAQGTITGFNSAHSVTVSNTANAVCTPNANADGCVFVWVPADDTIATQNAWNAAANACGSLALPAGEIFLQAPPGNTTSLCPQVTGSNDNLTGMDVYGAGQDATIIIMGPNSTFGNTMFSLPSGNFNRQRFHDFAIASFSPGAAASNGKNGFVIGFNGEIDHVNMQAYFPCDNVTCTNSFTPILATGVGNAYAKVHDNILVDSGNTSVSLSNAVFFNHNHIQTSNRCAQITGGPVVMSENNLVLCGVQGGLVFLTSGGSILSQNDTVSCLGSSLSCVNVSISGVTFIAHNATFSNAPTTTAPTLNIASGSAVILEGEKASVASSNGNGGTGNGISNAGTLTLRDTTVTSGSGTGLANAATGVVNVKEGNTLSNGLTNASGGIFQGQDGNGTYSGSCTGVVTSATTVGLYGLGQTTATTCTSTTVGSGRVMSKPGSVYALYCTATAGNQATDACTVVKNGGAQTMTCSLNGVANCFDGATGHVVTFIAGDILGIEAVGGTGTTLANVKGSLITN